MARGGGGNSKPVLAEIGNEEAADGGMSSGRFVPTVDLGGKGELTTIWLAEIGLSASEGSYEDAKEALLASLRMYIEDFESDERARKAAGAMAPLIEAAAAADREGRLAEFVFGD